MRFADIGWSRAVADWILRDIKRTPGHTTAHLRDFFVEALNGDMTIFVPLEQ